MPLQPVSNVSSRIFFVDSKGSGLVMYADKVLGTFSDKKTMVPGKLTDAARTADAALTAAKGAQIISLDTGVLYESTGAAWVAANSQSLVNIIGTAGSGNVLTAAISTSYTGTPSYQWTRAGVAITGATSSTYTQVTADEGNDLGCVVSGITPKYSSGTVKVPVPISAPALSISGTPATTGTAGTSYSSNFTAAGGATPYTYSLATGSLPSGLSLNSSTGAITGTPSAAGTSTGLSVRVTDAASATATSATFTLTVAAAPANSIPSFSYGVANPTGDAATFASIFGTTTNLTGASQAGRTGSFNTVSSVTNYTWLRVKASAAGATLRVFDGTTYGGFSGAQSTGIGATPSDQDPISSAFLTWTDSAGVVWNVYRSNGKASNFTGFSIL